MKAQFFEVGIFLTNYFKSVAFFVKEPFFCFLGFLLNKEVANLFLRLKSFCEARFESYIDSVPKSLQNQEKCFVHCFPNQTRRLVPLRAKNAWWGVPLPNEESKRGVHLFGYTIFKIYWQCCLLFSQIT